MLHSHGFCHTCPKVHEAALSLYHTQYSLYATNVVGLQLILIRIGYLMRIDVRYGANNNELSSLPIMSNESFAFSYDVKRGLEIEFKPR
jgi:hypothetical protein